MKHIIIASIAVLFGFSAMAQDAEQAVADATEAIAAAPQTAPAKPKFSSYWDNSLKTNLTLGQTGLWNWAAGGDHTVSLAAYIDGNDD